MSRLGRLFLATGLLGVLAMLFAGTALAQARLAATAVLQPTGGSRVNGSAILNTAGNQTVVTVRIGNAPPNSTHVNHIHVGSCEQEGGIVYPLTDLRTDAQGQATANTTVNAPLSAILGGGHYVNVHAGASLPSPGISCGNIRVTSGALPATGGPTAVGYAGLAALAAFGAGFMLRRRT